MVMSVGSSLNLDAGILSIVDDFITHAAISHILHSLFFREKSLREIIGGKDRIVVAVRPYCHQASVIQPVGTDGHHNCITHGVRKRLHATRGPSRRSQRRQWRLPAVESGGGGVDMSSTIDFRRVADGGFSRRGPFTPTHSSAAGCGVDIGPRSWRSGIYTHPLGARPCRCPFSLFDFSHGPHLLRLYHYRPLRSSLNPASTVPPSGWSDALVFFGGWRKGVGNWSRETGGQRRVRL